MNQPPNTTEEKCEHKEPTGQWAVRGGKSYATCKNCGEEYEKNKPCLKFEGNTQWCDKCGEASISH